MRTEKRTMFLALGVTDPTAAIETAVAMMETPAPDPRDEREITDHATLKYLRAFSASQTASPNESPIRLDSPFRFNREAEANGITDWSIEVLGKAKERVALQFDNNREPLETEPLRNIAGTVPRLSLWVRRK
jgi:hypothetical protein